MNGTRAYSDVNVMLVIEGGEVPLPLALLEHVSSMVAIPTASMSEEIIHGTRSAGDQLTIRF